LLAGAADFAGAAVFVEVDLLLPAEAASTPKVVKRISMIGRTAIPLRQRQRVFRIIKASLFIISYVSKGYV
jgi:hypothetical protein